jgi:hypothetical protein
MAAQPFFKGNYGSALARVDTRPIIEAGRAQGAMFQNLGNEVAGAIKQYGLNKEKQKENKNTIKSSIGILKRLQQIDSENAAQYETQIEQLNNEDIGLRERAGLADKTLKGISITGQMESNMLRNKSVADSLKSKQDSRDAVKSAFTQMGEVLNEAKQAQTEAREAGLPFEFTPKLQRMLEYPEIIKAGMESGDASLLGSFVSDPAMDKSRQLQIKKQERDVDKGTFERDLREERGGAAGEAERLDQADRLRTLSAMGLYNARMNMGSGGGGSGKTGTMQDSLEDTQKELSRISSLDTMFKDEDDKILSVGDLLESKPNNEIGLKEGYNLTKMSDLDRNNVQLFLTQSGLVQDAQRQMPAELRGNVDLSAFGNEPPQIGQEVEFQGRKARVVSIENGQVKVTYEGTLFEKNLEDINAEKREQARIEQERQAKFDRVAYPTDAMGRPTEYVY